MKHKDFLPLNLLHLSFHLFRIDFPLFVDANRVVSTSGLNRTEKDSNLTQARDDGIIR